jgi:hypothetical protein
MTGLLVVEQLDGRGVATASVRRVSFAEYLRAPEGERFVCASEPMREYYVIEPRPSEPKK